MAAQATSDTPNQRLMDGDSLCEKCSWIDFHSLFDEPCYDKRIVCTIVHATKRPSCPFCRLIVHTFWDEFEKLDVPAQRKMVCTISSVVPSSLRHRRSRSELPEEDAADSGILPYVVLGVGMESTPVFNNPGWKGTSLLLDRVAVPSKKSKDPTQAIIVRRRMEQVFSPGMLRSWLLESGRSRKQDDLDDNSDSTSVLSSTDLDQSSTKRKPAFLKGLFVHREPRQILPGRSRSPSSRQPSPSPEAGSFHGLIATARFRVIDVTSGDIISVRSPLPYVALSYVWGQSMATYIATSKDYAPKWHIPSRDRQRIKHWDSLPRTVRDAAKLTEAIGEAYLWVDALCIDQSDPKDKEVNIAYMDAIYANAHLTVVAADGTDAEHGLKRLYRAHSSDDDAESLNFETKGQPISMLAHREDFHAVIKSTNWSTRGWTLQERLLSKQSVCFTDSEVFFRSESMHARESYGLKTGDAAELTSVKYRTRHSPILDLRNYNVRDSEQEYKKYSWAAEELCSRNFTHISDRLDAFTGILNQCQPEATSSEVVMALSGLPKGLFTWGLTWKSFDKRKSKRILLDNRGSRGFPSWSWVGWSGRLFLPPYKSKAFKNSKMDVANTANVKWTNSAWPLGFQPHFIPVERPLQVVLHVWTDVALCRLIPEQHYWSGESAHRLVLQHRLDPLLYLSLDDVDAIMLLPEGLDGTSTIELIELTDITFLVVQCFDNHVERITVVDLMTMRDALSDQWETFFEPAYRRIR